MVTIGPIYWNQLCLIVNKFTLDFLDLEKNILSNKTTRGIGII
jgi:hypothetical protein